MEILEIEIGSKYEDSLGKAIYSKKGNLMKEIEKRIVTITNKTSNSIEFLDGGRFSSWISFEDFIRIERAVSELPMHSKLMDWASKKINVHDRYIFRIYSVS